VTLSTFPKDEYEVSPRNHAFMDLLSVIDQCYVRGFGACEPFSE
jgi:hypothetical protein